MFELVLIAILLAALAPPLYLMHQVSVLKRKINRALAVAGGPEGCGETQAVVQRELVQSFEVFDSLLATLQHTRGALSDTARAFVSTFRERAVAYVERGCEGSLLATQVREDRLKQLAGQLMLQHRDDFARRGAVSIDALDNGDFGEYLKLLKFLVQRHLAQISDAQGRPSAAPGMLRPAVV